MWIRGRSLRPGRNDNDEDEFNLDPSKDHSENVRDILTNICKRQGGTSERRRLSYLNAFVKLLTKCEHDYSKLGLNAEEILFCLRPALLHETTQVRSGGLRALRYMLQSKHEAQLCYKLQYPLLIARSMDLITGNDNERAQAMRVVRRLMCLDVASFPVCLARALVAIASGTDDRLINLTLGALAELCVLNPELLISVGGVTAILRSLNYVKSARMAEALVGSLLYLQNKPGTRLRAGLSLDCLAAPYTELQPCDKTKDSQSSDRLKWPHVTLLSTLRSWPGVLHFCHPLKDGLRSIVATLYLNQLDVRKAVLDLLYELLCLAQPEWSDEMSVALEAVDPSRSQDAFKLSEGFVAAEGKAVLPHLSKCRVNLSELHLALLLYCFLEVGLLDAIVEVIIAEDTFLSVRATILLGELLHLIHLLLPPECCNLTPSLPNLLSYAVRGRPHHPPLLGYPETPVTPQSSMQSTQSTGESYIGVDITNKKDLISRMGIRSGHSSVRTMSESSTTDRAARQEVTAEKRTGNEEESPYNSDRKDISDSNRRNSKSKGDQTSHLLRGVTEVLADMTNTSDIRISVKRARYKFTSSLPSSLPAPSPETPVSVRAQQRALAAVMALSRLHRLLRLRPAPASIHLDHVLASVSGTHTLDGIELARAKGKTLSRSKLNQALTKECDEAIKESQVLSNKDCFLWNWDIIKSILKSRPECLRKCEDSQHRQFLRRLVQFVQPSSRQMSRVDFSSDRRTVNMYTLTAIELLNVLLAADEPQSEGEKLLVELMTGVKTKFEAIITAKSAHDCMFNPTAVGNSLCQDYFLLAGHLSRTRPGCDLLDRLGIIQVFLVLATTSKHDCYVKLIISSLDYSTDERIRNIMVSTLVSKQISSRLYATKFLRVLLRTPLGKREGYAQWVIELLANQLSDESRAVSLCAVAALDEACDCKDYLDALIDLRPSLLHIGDKGLLLLVRFLSTEKGFRYMSEANFVSTQLTKWVRFNYKYVCIVEGEVADGLTLVERNEDGRYSSRLSHSKRVPSDVYVPPHLYGQLAQHAPGLAALLADDNINKLVQVVVGGECNTDSEILDLKAALWALGHLSSSPAGALWARGQSVTRAMVRLACSSPVYSIRSTAFQAIALTATNADGADTLRALGWHTVRHNRNQQWPVVPPLTLLEDALLQLQERCGTRDSSESSATNTDTATRNRLFILGEDPSEEVDGNDSFSGFTACERVVRERKSATLPPSGSSHSATHGYHHNRSYSESKADSGSDITDYRGQDHSTRLYSESSTSGGSSCGDSSQPRTYVIEKLMQTLSPIASTDSLSTIRSQRRMSLALSQGGQMSPQDMSGYAALRSLQRSRRPTLFSSPNLPMHFPSTAPHSLSPLSPIELFAFQDWRQMSPLVRPKHPDNHLIEPQFEVTGVHCPLPSDSQSTRGLHYESSRACIAQPPEDPTDENCGPCYQGICLPQNLICLFPEEGVTVKAQDTLQDNTSTTGMDMSSCDSETDTEGEKGTKPSAPRRRRHERATCLLCAVSRVAHTHQPRWRKVSASSQHRTRTETESSYGGEGESPVVLQWHNKMGLEGITSVDSSSTDITSVAQRSLGESFKSRSMVRKEILRLAEQLCNPILYKSCKQALLQLKQVYSDIFNDVCVYSDVCAVMASASLRVYARRFLQELFLDAPFSEIYEEPLNLLTNQNNADNDDSACGDKVSIGSETASSEDYAIAEPCSRKTSGPKMNGFDVEPRSGQGYELEVILESDARSESSDVCRLSGEGGRDSVTPLDEHGQSEGVECHLTVSRSSQQLRKEFFNSAVSPESKSNLEKESITSCVKVKSIKLDESFVSKVADSITKSQGMLETKPPSQPDNVLGLDEVCRGDQSLCQERNIEAIEDQEIKLQINLDDSVTLSETVGVSLPVTVEPSQGNRGQERSKLETKESSKADTSKTQSESFNKICEKTKGVKSSSKPSNQPSAQESSVPSNLKSPMSIKKGKKINTKSSSVPIKTEVPTRTSIEQSTVQNVESFNQKRENNSQKVNNKLKNDSSLAKCDSSLVKNDVNKVQGKTYELLTDGSSSSKGPSKNTKLKVGESPTGSGKPPSGLGRQQKKALSKTTN